MVGNILTERGTYLVVAPVKNGSQKVKMPPPIHWQRQISICESYGVHLECLGGYDILQDRNVDDIRI